jgi:4-hydroxy-tetrahydrodipicolinate synthase
MGADGAILAAPAYICAPEADIEAFFAECADAVELPARHLQQPAAGEDGPALVDHLLRLMKHPNVVVLKESTTRVGQVAQVLAARPDAAVMCCDSPNLGLVVPTMSLGGHGTANMTGNLDPAGMALLSTPWAEPQQSDGVPRDLPAAAAAAALHLFSAINPGGGEVADEGRGPAGRGLRRPLSGLKPDHLAKGLGIVRALGLDARYGWGKPALPLAAE